MEENNSKEINLLQLISVFFNWLSKIAKSVLQSLGFIAKLTYRHIVIFIIVVVLGILCGLYLSRPAARIYKAEAMAMLYGCNSETVKEISKQIENTLTTNSEISLATKLALPDSVASNVVSLQSFYVIDYLKDGGADKIDFTNSHSLTDTTTARMNDRIYLQIKTRNINQVPQVQAAILNFFNQNETMKTLFEIRKAELADRIALCNVESNRIDSLAKVSYFKNTDKQMKLENDRLLVGDQTKQLFYSNLIELHNIKAGAQDALTQFKQPMQLPSNFVVYPQPLNGQMKYTVYGIIFGYLIALALALLVENLKKIFQFLKN